MKRKSCGLRISISILMSAILGLLCEDVTAHQPRSLMWKYSEVTEQCKDPDGDGKKMSDLSSEDVGNDWLDVMIDEWGSTYTRDYTIYASELTDEDDCTWGQDHALGNLDDGDATFLSTHSVVKPEDDPDYWRVRISTNSGNEGNSTCASRSTNMSLGDNDAEFVHTTGCHSCEWSLVSAPGGFNAKDGRLHQFGGFHGEYWTNGGGGIDDFAEEGFTSASSLSYAWIENMTVWNINGSYDNCAMSLVQGTSPSNATARKNYEDYNPSQYEDPDGQATKYHFYCGCDPSGDYSYALVCS